MVTAWVVSDLDRFDSILSQSRPFGDSAYIHEQMRLAFKRRIGEISVSLPVARRLLNSLNEADWQVEYRVLGDPTVRAVVQQALGQTVANIETVLPLEQCQELLDETVRHLDTGAVDSPLKSCAVDVHRLGTTPSTAWIWTGERTDDIFGRTFQQLVEHEYKESLCTPNSADIAMLQKATRLLEELLPLLSRSALSHAHVIGIFPGTGKWQKVASSSQFRLTGAIFLNQKTLKNPWWVAEHLLHESLHQKLYDFRHAHSLLACDDPSAMNRSGHVGTVVSLWNTPGLDASNCWDPHRVVAAFHVYVHLALFCALAERLVPELEKTYGPLSVLPAMTESRRAFERARYLGEHLQSSCLPELGLAGQRLVEWFGSILDAMDPSPAPAGAYLHLLLDRYLLEAAKIQQERPSCNLVRQLATLIRNETTSTQAVLNAIDAQAESREFSAAVANTAKLRPETAFPDIRRLIAETLKRAAPDGYSLNTRSMNAMKAPDEMVREMVERSSRELAVMGALGYPREISGDAAAGP